jgi:predicted  nucleic acid-binding Zn-ribbon protein
VENPELANQRGIKILELTNKLTEKEKEINDLQAQIDQQKLEKITSDNGVNELAEKINRLEQEGRKLKKESRQLKDELEEVKQAQDAAQEELATEKTNHQNTQQTLKT